MTREEKDDHFGRAILEIESIMHDYIDKTTTDQIILEILPVIGFMLKQEMDYILNKVQESFKAALPTHDQLGNPFDGVEDDETET